MTADEVPRMSAEAEAEATPLLQIENGRDGDAPPATPVTKSPTAVIGIVSFMIACMTLSGTLSLIPLGRLIEDAICRRFYGEPGPIEEKRCKVNEVQAELAWVGGLYLVIGAVVELIVSFPWGILSDRIGRKPVLRLSYFSLIIGGCWSSLVIIRQDILPVRMLLIGPIFSVFGGGLPVMVAVIHSIIADVATERTSGFLFMSLGAVLGGVTGPALAAKLMELYSPWVPLWITGFVLTPIVFITIIFLPETLHLQSTTHESFSKEQSFVAAIRSHLEHAVDRLSESLSMLKTPSLAILLATFLVQSPVQISQGQTLAQTISKRFHWTLAQTGYLFSARGLLTVVVLGVLPAVSSALTSPRMGRFRLSPFRKDLRLQQASLLALAAGSALTGGGATFGAVAAGQAVSTLGVGGASAAKALAAYYVDAAHAARLYTLVGMVETAGSFVAGPALAWAFDAGMRRGGRWTGLPFFLVAGACGLALGAVCLVRQPEAAKKGGDCEAPDDGELPRTGGDTVL